MTEEKLKSLAMDVFKGKVFFLKDVGNPLLAPLVFMPLGLMDQEQRAQLIRDIEDDKVFTLYEYYDKALPRSINGYPMFPSVNMLSRQEHSELHYLLEKIRSATKEVLGD